MPVIPDAPTPAPAPAPAQFPTPAQFSAPVLAAAPSPVPPLQPPSALSRAPAVRAALARYAAPLAALLTPKTTPIVLVVAGGLFWLWALAMFGWIFMLPLRHARAEAAAEAASASASAASVDVAPPSAATAAGAPAGLPVAKPLPAADSVPARAPDAPGAAGGVPFRNGAAIRALDGKWRDVAKCRRGKAWGKASTTVTFSNDGSVSHVEVGEPFGGTPTGDCIADALAGTHVEPFGDKSAVLVYKVYVAPK
jgi:hypothetical protein